MRLRIVSLVAGLALIIAAAPSAQAAGPRAEPTASYIVSLQAGQDTDRSVGELGQRHGFAPTHVYHNALRGFAADLSSAQLAAVASDPAVRTVVADSAVTALGQPTGVHRIDTPTGPLGTVAAAAAVNVDVAVVDTGIDASHPLLNVVGGINCSNGGGRNYADGNGHGTHVAGTIGASDNGAGVVGVAPGARLWAVRVLDDTGSGSWSTVICGIDFVAAHADTIKVANMSLGGIGTAGSCTDGGMRQAICAATAAGVTFVVAAGNLASDFSTFVPASYPEVLTVTAMADFNGLPGGGAAPTCRFGVDDAATEFSNYAVSAEAQAHTIAAPGVCILSTWMGGGYNTISGTSMASPHVTGAAARCIAVGLCPGGPAVVQTKLRGDAAAQGPRFGFTGDANVLTTSTKGGGRWKNTPPDVSPTKYYGFLVFAGGY